MGAESDFFVPIARDLPASETLPEQIHVSESGFCELYLVRRDGRCRVCKVLKPEYRGNPVYESLLRKEFDLGFGLDHPGICRTLDWTRLPGFGSAILMEWVDGRTLDVWAAQEQPGPDRIRQVFSEICDALDYIHRRQLVHRDIKPENVMLTHDGDHVKLIDFGLADADAWYLYKQAAGTRDYAAPEVLAGRAADARSDIFSVGVMLGELGGRRFSRQAAKCMRQLPDRRYRSAGQLRHALMRRTGLRCMVIVPVILAVVVALWLLWDFRRSERHAARIFHEATDLIENALR